MSFEIDMESYAGGNRDPAAVDLTTGTNSYGQDGEEYPVQANLLEPSAEMEAKEEAPEPVINPQSEHFRALREEVDRMKADRETERREHQLQLDMLRVNMAQQQNQQVRQPETQQPKKMFEGMEGNDIPNVDEIRKEWAQREIDYQARLEELQVQQSYPDYAEVLEKFVAPLVKNKPHLLEGIQRATNKAMFAYELGKMEQAKYQPPQVVAPAPEAPPQRSESAQRMVDNSRKPGTLSQAGGQAALSKADYFATMSDKEFMKFASRNLEAI